MLGSTAFLVGAESPNFRNSFDADLSERYQNGLKEGDLNQRDEEILKPRPFHHFVLTNIYFMSFFVYGLWILLGILFYAYYDNFTFATAYYYSMDAGLSIGFCNPSETTDNSKLFTVFYVLLGSSVISGFLGLLANTLVNGQRKTIVEARHGYGAISYKQSGQITIFSVVNYVWYHFKLSIGWYSNRPIVILTSAFVIWMGLGIAYGMTYENYSFITALYWAVTTCATGGLQSPPCLNISPDGICDMGNTRGGLMGVFMMIGVPLYAFTLAQFSRLVVGFIVYARQDEQMNQPIEDVDFIFAANVLSPEGSVTLVLGEYILLELMRMGQTNRHQIESIKKKFYQLDKLKRGELDIDDLIKIGKVVKRKVHSIEKPNNNSKQRTRSMELFDMAGIVRRVSNSHIDTGSILSSLGIALTPPKQSFSASSVTTDAVQPKREEDKKILDNPDLILSETRRHNKKTFRKSIRNSQYLTQVQWADPEHGAHLNIPGEDYTHRVHAQDFPEFESFDFNIDDLESSTYPRSNNMSQSSSPLTIDVKHNENYDLKDRIPFPAMEYETPRRSSHVSIHFPFSPIEEKPEEEEENKDDEEDFIPNHFLEENNIDVNVDV